MLETAGGGGAGDRFWSIALLPRVYAAADDVLADAMMRIARVIYRTAETHQTCREIAIMAAYGLGRGWKSAGDRRAGLPIAKGDGGC